MLVAADITESYQTYGGVLHPVYLTSYTGQVTTLCSIIAVCSNLTRCSSPVFSGESVALPKLLLTAEVKPCSQVLLRCAITCRNVQMLKQKVVICISGGWRSAPLERRDWTSSWPLQHHQYFSCSPASPGALKHIHLAANSANGLIHHGAEGTAADKL